MKIKQHLDGSIEAVADGGGLAKFLLGGGLLLSGLALYHFRVGAANAEQFIGSVCAAALFLGAFLVTYENASFVFKRAARIVVWRRRTLFSRHSGQVAFSAVECVAAEAIVDHEPGTGGGLSRRLVLRTATGVIPFTRAYSGDPDGELLRLAAQLNALFGRDPKAEILGRIRELVAAGRENDAVRLIHAERGIPLKAARAEVRSLKLDPPDAHLTDMQAEPGTDIGHQARHRLTLPPDAMAALARDNKIEAIKCVRVAHGLGLKEAKDVVEAWLTSGKRE